MKSIKALALALSKPEESESFKKGNSSINQPGRDEVIVIQLKQLYEYIKLYREYQKLYFTKLKRREFAKDEQHFMMKYQEKIDLLLRTIKL